MINFYKKRIFNISLQSITKKYQIILLIIVILTAIFYRFWHIRDYIMFLGDEGRDMLIIRQMIIEKHLTFLGPTASVGGFYLGPIYYWMAAPFLFAWRFDPVGPAYMVAIFGVATVFLLYRFLKDSVGFWPAILASGLYSSAPLIVRYSRSSWNPNPLPFFALLLIYFIYLGIKHDKIRYFLFAGACYGIVIQLHYLATILIAITGLIIIVNTNFKKWFLLFLFFILGSLITFSPFLLFELKNGFPNINTIFEFVTRGSTTGFNTIHLVWLFSNTGNIFLEEISNFRGTFFTKFVFWIIIVNGIFGLVKNWQKRDIKLIFSIGFIWFIGGLVGLRFYTGQLFDYYFGFLFPAPFVLAGLTIYLLWNKLLFKIISLLVTVIIIAYLLTNSFFLKPPNRLINQTQFIADFVINKAEDEPFNFALITDSNSDHAYRYYLDLKGYSPIDLETLITDQLLVVCESKKCAPLGHPTWEIAGFGRAEIAGEWEISKFGIRVFRLIHWPGVPNPAGKPAVKDG